MDVDRLFTAGGDRVSIDRPPHRLDRLRHWMVAQSVDACVVAGAENVMHLAAYHRRDGGPSALVIDRDGVRTLAAARDEVPLAVAIGAADEFVAYGQRGFGIDLNPLPTLTNILATVPAVRNARRLGIVDPTGDLAELLARQCSAKAISAADALARIRMVRDEDELVRALHSYQLSWLAQDAVARLAAPGITEIELYDAAQSAAQIAHGEPIEFFADLLSGPNTGNVGAPVQIAGSRRVDAGDPVVADIVIRAGGYGGDTAETHIVGDNPMIAAIRNELLEIREACAAELIPGNTGAAVYASMRERVLTAFPEGELPHHAGHGVAVTAFEDPHMIPGDVTPLENWMLISLEPGVYMAGSHGARVENSYIVTPDGGVELRTALGAR